MLVASVLPEFRAAQVSVMTSLVASVVNVGKEEARNVGVTLTIPQTFLPVLPVDFLFQPNDFTGGLIGMPNGPINILPGGTQFFVLGVTPSGTLPPNGMKLACFPVLCALRLRFAQAVLSLSKGARRTAWR